jgi:hypothetical protein
VGGIGGYGLGLAFDLNQNVTIAFDTASDSNLNNIGGDPALLINLNMVQLTGGYAFAVKGAVANPMRSGAHGGLGVKFSEKLALHGYYAQLSQIWFDLKISL